MNGNLNILTHQSQWLHLQGLLEQNRLHPAWLLTGIQGIGKATFATNFARHLLLIGQEANKGFIESMLVQGIHPNLMIVDKGVNEDGEPNNEISVHHVRKIAGFVQQSPAIKGWRVIIIDAVDDMNRHAANALLKILEEPPAQTIFLLVCHALGRIMPTIRSRCCLLSFKGIEPTVLKEYIPDASDLSLALAGGSFGLLKNLQEYNVETIFSDCLSLVQAALKNNFASVTKYTTTIDKKDDKNGVILQVIQWMLYRITCLQHGQPSAISTDQKLMSLAQQRPAGFWVKAYEEYSAYLRAIVGGHLDPGHVLLAALLIIENPLLAKEFTNV